MSESKNLAGLFFGEESQTKNTGSINFDDYSLLQPLRTLTPDAKHNTIFRTSKKKTRSRGKHKQSNKGSRGRWKDKEVASYWMDSVSQN